LITPETTPTSIPTNPATGPAEEPIPSATPTESNALAADLRRDRARLGRELPYLIGEGDGESSCCAFLQGRINGITQPAREQFMAGIPDAINVNLRFGKRAGGLYSRRLKASTACRDWRAAEDSDDFAHEAQTLRPQAALRHQSWLPRAEPTDLPPQLVGLVEIPGGYRVEDANRRPLAYFSLTP
jgi:hypothetical protein